MPSKPVFSLWILLMFSLNSNAQNWKWAFGDPVGGLSHGVSIATDKNGFIYTLIYAGVNSYSLSCFPGTLLIKCDSLGQIHWVVSFSGSPEEVTTDAQGNAYVCGTFGTPGRFCGGGNKDTTLNAIGDTDAFLAKYDTNGNLLWARSYGYAISKDVITAIKTDPSGNVFAAGGCGYVDSASIPHGENFLIKYNSQGNVVWSQNSGWRGMAEPTSMDVDMLGNCYVTGIFRDSAFFGNTVLTSTAIISTIFIAKYDGSGNLKMTKKTGLSPSICHAAGISLDHNGFLFLTGRYTTPTVFDTFTLTGGGSNSITAMFIAKADTLGNIVWAQKGEADWGWGVTADASGNAYVCGKYSKKPSIFGTNSNTLSLTHNNPNGQLFVAKYGPSGNLNWLRSTGYEGEDNTASAIASDRFDNYYVTGNFYDSVRFANSILPASQASLSYWSFFIARLGGRPDHSVGISTEDPSSNISVYPNPAKYALYIDLAEETAPSHISLTFFNAIGQVVLEKIYNGRKGESIEITTDFLQRGIYLVEIRSGNRREVRKIILE